MSRTNPIADTTGKLTAPWLSDVLRASGHLDDASVTGVEVSPLGTGQMCNSVRLTLSYDRETTGPATLVAKLPSADEATRATAKSLRSYEIEVRFYQQLASHLPVSTPEMIYSDIDVESSSFVLLLQDLAPARPGDQLQGCSPAIAKVAVDELVKLHAPRWDDPTLTSLEWLSGDVEARRQFLLTLLPSLWDGFRSALRSPPWHRGPSCR